jgi:glycosyltransferase involved in cell wall biosynthesis
VSVGRLIEIKNPFVVLSSFLEYPCADSRLVFIGEGHLEDDLRAHAPSRPNGVTVDFTGLISRTHVYRKLAEANLFVSASRSEGMPVAILEAMACRCPVVLSDIPPHREIVKDADFIPLIDPDDVPGFASEISRFQEMSPMERARIGDRCRSVIEERFGLALTHENYENVYREVSQN